MSNLLFICSYGQVRSVTAVNMYGGRSAGLHDRYANEPSKGKKSKIEISCEWADRIFMFEDLDNYNQKTFAKHYPQFTYKLKVLYIPDDYGVVDHPRLVERIKEAMKHVD